MSYRLFLDDERLPHHVKWIELPLGPWQVVRSYDAFVAHIAIHGLPSHVSFDHDLGPQAYADIAGFVAAKAGPGAYDALYRDEKREKTGYHAARWLAEHCVKYALPLPTWTVHSMNPIGRENIESVLRSAARVLPST
jgi:hypothetical protein